MKKIIFLLGILISTLISSCSEFQEISFSGIENVKVTKLSKDGVEADITAKIKNPNRSSFTIYRSALDVNFNGIDCGQAVLTDKVKIKGNSEQAYTFHIRSDFSKLSMTELPKLLGMAMSKHAKLNMKGELNVGKAFVKKKYPVEFSKSVSLDGI